MAEFRSRVEKYEAAHDKLLSEISDGLERGATSVDMQDELDEFKAGVNVRWVCFYFIMLYVF